MKKIFYFLVLNVLVIFTSCKEDSPEPTLSISPGNAIVFTAEAPISETVTITVITNQSSWDAVSNQTWCKITKDVANSRFTVSADPNAAITPPPATTITVTAGDATPVNIAVTQAAAPVATVTVIPNAQEFLYNETTVKTSTITTNQSSWSFSKSDGADWLTIEKDGNALKLSVTVNAGADRNAVVTITAGTTGNSATATIGIAQTAGLLQIEYVNIPVGTFKMGSPITEPDRDAKETEHQVTISAFQMSKYEVTNAQFAAFLNAKEVDISGKLKTAEYGLRTLLLAHNKMGVYYNNKISLWEPVSGKENHPVVDVYWYGAVEFARWVGASLPTEAQWEYACRGGLSKPFGIGDGTKLDHTMAVFNWYYCYELPGGQYSTTITWLSTTLPVGSYSPNNYGLYDMHGNAAEWCSDWYANYPTSAESNPTGPSTGSSKVIRGGSYLNMSQFCRSASRRGNSPGDVTGNEGIRLVKSF